MEAFFTFLKSSSSFEVCMKLFQTLVTTPIYVYLLKLNDPMLTITGLLVTIGGLIITGTATKVQHLI